MKMVCTDEIKEWLRVNLTAEKYVHSLGTAEAAKAIAEKCAYDEDKAYFAGLVHDCAKNLAFEKQLELVKRAPFKLIEGETDNAKILHAPAGAVLAREIFGIEDEEILSAIRWHTLGRVEMSMLEKIIFLADKIEPETRGREDYEKRLKALDNPKMLEKEILDCYIYTIKSLVDRQLKICNQTIDVYNYLSEKGSRLG